MRIALVADCHVGNHKRYGGEVKAGINSRCQATLDVLKAAADRAAQEADLFISLGDLIDVTRPEPQVLAALQEVLAQHPCSQLLLGNHEMVSTQDGDHALGPLNVGAHVIAKPLYAQGIAYVPFEPGPAHMWLPQRVDELARKGPIQVVVTHVGIADDDTPGFLRGAHDSITIDDADMICQAHNIAAFFSGNWHERRCWIGSTRTVLVKGEQGNLVLDLDGGNPARVRSDQHGRNSSVRARGDMGGGSREKGAVWDDRGSSLSQSSVRESDASGGGYAGGKRAEGREPSSEECASRSMPERSSVLSEEERRSPVRGVRQRAKAGALRGPLILQVGALVPTGFDNPGLKGYGSYVVYDMATNEITIHELPGPRFLKVRSEKESARAKEEAEAMGCNLFIEEVVEDERAEKAVRAAVEKATNAGSLEESVAAYVEGMDLDESVDRKRVLERVLGYLKE